MDSTSKISSIQKLTFEQAYQELELVLEQLEKGDLPLETGLSLYEKGQALAKYCTKLLENAELKVLQISGDAINPMPISESE